MPLFTKGQAIKWMGTCLPCPPSSNAPVIYFELLLFQLKNSHYIVKQSFLALFRGPQYSRSHYAKVYCTRKEVCTCYLADTHNLASGKLISKVSFMSYLQAKNKVLILGHLKMYTFKSRF